MRSRPSKLSDTELQRSRRALAVLVGALAESSLLQHHLYGVIWVWTCLFLDCLTDLGEVCLDLTDVSGGGVCKYLVGRPVLVDVDEFEGRKEEGVDWVVLRT